MAGFFEFGEFRWLSHRNAKLSMLSAKIIIEDYKKCIKAIDHLLCEF